MVYFWVSSSRYAAIVKASKAPPVPPRPKTNAAAPNAEAIAATAQVKEALSTIQTIMAAFADVREHVAEGAGTEALTHIENSVAKISELFGTKITVDRPSSTASKVASPTEEKAVPTTPTDTLKQDKPETKIETGKTELQTPASAQSQDAFPTSTEKFDITEAPPKAEENPEPSAEDLAKEKEERLKQAKLQLEQLTIDIEMHRAIMTMHENIAAVQAEQQSAATLRDAAVSTLEQFKKEHPTVDAERLCGAFKTEQAPFLTKGIVVCSRYAASIAELEDKCATATASLEKVSRKAIKTGAAVSACEKTLAAMDEANTDGVCCPRVHRVGYVYSLKRDDFRVGVSSNVEVSRT